MKKNKKFNLKKLDKQDKALLGTLVSLLILVAVLGIVALNMKEGIEEANITIPILEEASRNEISVDLADMKAGDTKEYVFNVTNFRDNDVNKKKVTYEIEVINAPCATITIKKNENSKTDFQTHTIKNENTKLTDNKLPKNQKTTDTYHMTIKAIETPSKGEKITLKINN